MNTKQIAVSPGVLPAMHLEKLSEPIASRHGIRDRAGTTMAEVLVAAVLLVTLFSVAATTVVQTTGIWRQISQSELAMDELANQIERLLAVSDQKLDESIADLTPTETTMAALPGANLKAKRISDQNGERIELSLNWTRLPPGQPITLVGWIDASDPGDEQGEQK